jgi:alpha-galactosidase
LNSAFTADQIVSTPLCATFIPDHWAINASHPGAQLYYDSVVSKWADEGIDFIYLDGVVGADMAKCGCHIAAAELVSDSLKRLGNGMHLFISAGPPGMTIGCPFEALTELAPYVRVGSDTVDSWAGSVEAGFSQFTRLTAPSIGPHHFGDLASLMAGKVHCNKQSNGRTCGPGPDYEIPGPESSMSEDEVYSYTSMISIFRSTWWPSGALSEMSDFYLKLLTNDAAIRVTMASTRTRQVIDAGSKSFAGPGIVWTADDNLESDWKYVLLVNMGENLTEVGVELPELGIPAAHSCQLDEIWNGTAIGRSAVGRVRAMLRAHASLFVRLSACGAH